MKTLVRKSEKTMRSLRFAGKIFSKKMKEFEMYKGFYKNYKFSLDKQISDQNVSFLIIFHL